MSKRRLVITAVLTGQSQLQVAATYGVSQGWISKLMARYRLEGEGAFEPLSRAPSTSPGATPPETVVLVLRLREQLTHAGLDAGADTIGWHLTHHHATTVSRATIKRILTRAGAVTPEPNERPKSSYVRFEAEQPNQTWQADFTHHRLQDGTVHLTHRGGIRRTEQGTDVEILTWLDDCSRYALSVTAHRPVTGPIVLATFGKAAATHGFPASTLTDNGRVFTVRLFGGTAGRNHLEHELRERNITPKNGKPNHRPKAKSNGSSRPSKREPVDAATGTGAPTTARLMATTMMVMWVPLNRRGLSTTSSKAYGPRAGPHRGRHRPTPARAKAEDSLRC